MKRPKEIYKHFTKLAWKKKIENAIEEIEKMRILKLK